MTQDENLHVSPRDELFQPIDIVIWTPFGLAFKRDMKTLMNKTEAKSVLWAVSSGLINEKEHRFLKLAGNFVAVAMPENVRSHSARDV